MLVFLTYLIITLIIIAYNWPGYCWEVLTGLYIASRIINFHTYSTLTIIISTILVAIALIRRFTFFQRHISKLLFRYASKNTPKISTTEQKALDIGDVWFEQSLFIGKPDWTQLAAIKTTLTAEEQAFIDQETYQLCEMLDEWSINQTGDLPPAVWDFIRQQGFLGLVIDKKYGGKGFSARAHSDIIIKLASRSINVAVSVMVPNSLGPGELLHYYGTSKQKQYYLPRLAKGIDIPCFALTEPTAGSDATSIRSEAIVCQKMLDEQLILGLDITLNKRWITLAPIATLIGLAVDLKDPEKLLQNNGQEGITCVLIHRDTPNLEIGHRHRPAYQVFMNGPIRGDHLFIPIDQIIGGQKNAGKGWEMLLECLSIGRSISLPAMATASAASAYVLTSAYARIRRQFHLELAQFEGVQEAMAKIAGLSYINYATRLLTLAAVDAKKKPSIASAIAKCYTTEHSRTIINHAMDIHGGKAVVLGPHNYLATQYASIPIMINVEGANIMTRNLLIFGQGSIACHPFLRKELNAIMENDHQAFHQHIWQHIHYTITTFAQAFCATWSSGKFIKTPHTIWNREAQKITHLSGVFAFLADFSLIYLGGKLKRKERLSARLADALSYLYMASACLHYAAQNDSKKTQEAQWALQYCFYQVQQACIGLCNNFPNHMIGTLLRWLIIPSTNSMPYPNDQSSHAVAKRMTENHSLRDTFKSCLHYSNNNSNTIEQLEATFQSLIKHEALYKKMHHLHDLPLTVLKDKLAIAVKQGIITKQEMQDMLDTESARWEAIQVDEFNS